MHEAWKEEELSYIRLVGNPETKKVERELVILLPVGCYWAKKSGSCSYCGFQPAVEAFKANFGDVDLLEILKHAVHKQELPFERISFFVGGSFLEVPPHKQIELFNYVNNLNVKAVYIETRPELIKVENIQILKDCLHNKELVVAIGLESSSEHIRNNVHKKGFFNAVYLAAMAALKTAGVKSLIYVFYKAPMADITDKQAYEDAMETIKFAFASGADSVEIESGYVVENSFIHDLYNSNQYEPLKLWSIIKLIKDSNVLGLGTCALGYFSDTPEPVAIPRNCDKCSDTLYSLLQKYRETVDMEHILNIQDCECKNEWQKAWEKE